MGEYLLSFHYGCIFGFDLFRSRLKQGNGVYNRYHRTKSHCLYLDSLYFSSSAWDLSLPEEKKRNFPFKDSIEPMKGIGVKMGLRMHCNLYM